MSPRSFFRSICLSLCAFIFYFQAFTQVPEKLTSGEIYRSIEKLNFLGSALYIAAHPDDENTRLISHLSNEILANTAYLSLTRGDGGQNRIGSEIRELLGVMRTQELLEARKIDGGGQYFTRANDFGYSKHPDETLAIWNKDEVLSDVVRVIRKFRPDVIINRFDHRTPGSNHGHHTSSAILSVESYDITGDKTVYPGQLDKLNTWQPTRIFFNTSWWFYGGRDKFKAADKSKLIAVDIGGYLPHSGKSNNEIAAESRSMHKSQGFGATGTRGTEMEYLELVKGSRPNNNENLFDGINTTWSRVKEGKHIEELVKNVIIEYDFNAPHNSISDLLKIRKEIAEVKDKHWKKIKLAEIDRIIIAATATFIEFKANSEYINPGDNLMISMEALNRSPSLMKIIGINSAAIEVDTSLNIELHENQSNKIEFLATSLTNLPLSNPYWLNEMGSLGMYKVSDYGLIGSPENAAPISFNIDMTIDGEPLTITRNLIYKYNDPVKGEVYKPFGIHPRASVSLDQNVIIFSDDQPKDITVKIKSFSDAISGKLALQSGNDWKTEPSHYIVSLDKINQEAFYTFKIFAPTSHSTNIISPVLIDDNNNTFQNELVELDYDHIPYQSVIRKSESKVVKLDIKKEGNRIAYIEGAGDKVAENLRQIGYEVDEFHPDELTASTLTGYDACIVGIRAFNVHKSLKIKNEILFDFAKTGGTVIVQYQTNRGLKGSDISPLHLELGRDRVTNEFSDVTFVSPNHRVLNAPNKLSQKDFEDWVQERGLYFPKDWHEDYEPILGMNDKGEELKTSSILIAPYGDGHYIYTGISFFRVLPAGVSGAYRLLANLISVK